MKKSVVVFDFDGVLTVGGEGLKQRAWDLLALPWGIHDSNALFQKKKEFSGGKGSRYDILRGAFESLVAYRVCTANDVAILTDAYADCYNTIVQKLLEKSGMPEGTEKALTRLVDAGCTLFVNSATPEKAVRQSVQNFNIAHRFRGVFGQPMTKEQNLVRAQHVAQVDRSFVLFVGDSDSDWMASKEFGCDFVGVANQWNKWKEDAVSFPLVNSIAELPALLAE